MEENEQIRVSNSGLIILWPFFTAFFERAGYMQETTFISSNHQNRAVYALQYLGYMSTDFPEYELPLNKILVGMAVEDTVDPIEALTTEEMELSKGLLEGGLIHNWPKVQNSSPEAIQESFLQREGVITMGREQLELKVEKKGLDILMHELSWSVSLIKLPWMQKPLHIDWM